MSAVAGAAPTPPNWLNLTGSSDASDPSAPSSSNDSTVDSLANESTFLQLLVAQIQNQDPDNPMDGTQFLSQLAEFSDLEQTMQVRQDTDSIQQLLSQYLPAAAPSGSSTTAPISGSSGAGSTPATGTGSTGQN
jgi:flagellar basal-body rod modification protein FlgD